MKINRPTTADRVNQLLSKDEPTFLGQPELSKIDIALALNWYSQNKGKEDSHKYLAHYCKVNGINATAEQISAQPSTLGFICRMISRDAVLDVTSRRWVATRLAVMTSLIVRDALFGEPKDMTMATTPVKVVTIQDRLKQKSSKCIGELEGAVDSYILSDFKKIPNTLDIMRNQEIKGAHGPAIVNFFKRYRDEFRVALTEKDEQINEAYSNFTLVQMKKMEALYDQIISDALKVMGESQAAREPRAKKPKSPEKQIKKLKYCREHPALEVKSIPPIRMIGAEGVFVYNHKTRMLSHYVADDADGLGVKGSSFVQYSKTNSRTKKLRKPEEVIPQILSGGKVYLKNLMEKLTTKDAKVSGRLNDDVLLLRVIA
jgi:hypothetical protein